MNKKASFPILKQRIEQLRKEIDRMEDNNDGTLQWVDTLQGLIIQLDALENKLFERMAEYE